MGRARGYDDNDDDGYGEGMPPGVDWNNNDDVYRYSRNPGLLAAAPLAQSRAEFAQQLREAAARERRAARKSRSLYTKAARLAGDTREGAANWVRRQSQAPQHAMVILGDEADFLPVARRVNAPGSDPLASLVMMEMTAHQHLGNPVPVAEEPRVARARAMKAQSRRLLRLVRGGKLLALVVVCVVLSITLDEALPAPTSSSFRKYFLVLAHALLGLTAVWLFLVVLRGIGVSSSVARLAVTIFSNAPDAVDNADAVARRVGDGRGLRARARDALANPRETWDDAREALAGARRRGGDWAGAQAASLRGGLRSLRDRRWRWAHPDAIALDDDYDVQKVRGADGSVLFETPRDGSGRDRLLTAQEVRAERWRVLKLKAQHLQRLKTFTKVASVVFIFAAISVVLDQAFNALGTATSASQGARYLTVTLRVVTGMAAVWLLGLFLRMAQLSRSIADISEAAAEVGRTAAGFVVS